MTKVLIWLASGEKAKLMPGILWGLNATRNNWVDEVRFVIFGDSERLIMNDDELFSMVSEVRGTMYCKHVAEAEGIEAGLEEKGAYLVNVGQPIAEAIKDGFTVITF